MKPTNTRASYGGTADEWIARAENMLRLTENAAEYAAGVGKAILLRNADELQHQIRVAKTELAGRTRSTELAGRTERTGGRSCGV